MSDEAREAACRAVLDKIMNRHASRVMFHDRALAEEAWAALSTAPSNPPAPEGSWRDIASAPKDGTMILLSDGKFVVPGAFCPSLHGEKYPWAFVEEFKDDPSGCCQMEEPYRLETNAWKEAGPTHWMPLPPAPSASREGER